MRDQWRAVRLLVATAWSVDRWRTIGLLLEPIGFLRIPLFGWFLMIVTDAALRRDTWPVIFGAGGIAGSAVLGFAGKWFGSQIRLRLIEMVGFALNREIAMLTSSVPGLEHHERADFQDRLELLQQGHGLLGNSLNALVSTAKVVLFGVGTLVLLAVVAPWLLLVVIFALPALPITRTQQRWLAAAENRMAEPSRRFRYLQQLSVERNAGMELRVFGLEHEIARRLEHAWNESQAIVLDVTRKNALLASAGDVIFLIGFASVIGLMLWRASVGQATMGEMVMAIYLTQEVRSAVIDPIRSLAGLGETLRAAGRMLWVKDYIARTASGSRGSRLAPNRLNRGIVFDHVSFRYPGTERWVLWDVSLEIPPGAVLAIVGESGAGKTTLVKLMCRMYEPTEGRILVDGVDLADIDVEAWRARLSAAFQDFARFELIARHSVGLGDLRRLDDRGAVHAALDRAGAADVLAGAPAGVDVQLGARWAGGVDLSTGQWQKLALGRALMREDPLVVFLDEPTASLDAMTERALFDRYANAARNASARGALTVLVSHRFSTVCCANLIVVLNDGRVSELGSHRELMLRGGLYAELYAMQARAYA